MKTNTDYFHHYNILGLQPGASQKEVQSAFRRLAKLCHPDQDSSPYAEMRYKEIRAAYDALRNKAKTRPVTGAVSRDYAPTSPPPRAGYGAAGKRHGAAPNYRTVCGKDWRYTESDEESDFEFGDLVSGYRTTKPPPKRLPFSLENLPDIFRISFNEVFGIGMTIRVLLAAWGFWTTLTWIGWGGMWKTSVILCVLLGALLFRYYFSRPGQFPTANIVGSLLCSVALSIICTATTNQTYVMFRARTLGSDALSLLFTPRVERTLSDAVILHARVTTGVRHHYFDESGAIFAYLAVMIFLYLFLLWARPLSWLEKLGAR